MHGSMNIKFKTECCKTVSTVLYQTKRPSHSFKILTLQVISSSSTSTEQN